MPKNVEVEPITDEVLREADARNKARTASPLFVTNAAIDTWQGVLLLRLRSNVELRIPIRAIEEIAQKPVELLQKVKATATGGLLFEDADVAIDTNGSSRSVVADQRYLVRLSGNHRQNCAPHYKVKLATKVE